MLKEKISQEVKESLKSHDQVRLSTMRMLLSALNYAQIDKMRELTPQEEIDVVSKEAKKRNDAIEMYTKANAIDKAQAEKDELLILKEFLPKELSSDELNALIEQSIEENGKDFGKVMKGVISKAQGAVDGKVVSELVRAKLS